MNPISEEAKAMMRPVKHLLAVMIAVSVVPAGCGKNKDYRGRYLELQERHEREITQLRAQREKEKKDYERKLGLLEARLDALKAELGSAERLLDDKTAKGGRSPAPGGAVSQAETAGAGEKPEAGSEAASFIQPTSPETDKLLQEFMEDYAAGMEPGRRAQFTKDFSEYLAKLREAAAEATDSQRKETLLENLQQRLSETTDDREREELERRLKNIRSAGGEDLAGVLDYYQKLDDIRNLKNLMDEYNISRQDLWERGLEPPPRDSWGPDPKEIAYNLRNFVNRYEPLIDPDQRDQYRRDFEKYLSELTARPSDEQALQRRDRMVADLQERALTASEEEKSRLESRIRRLENADPDEFRRPVQSSTLRELSELAEKYNIPRDELRQSGASVPGWGFGMRR